MANKQTVFADRLVGLSIHNGLVRMDLAVVAGAGKTKDDQPALKMDVTHQLVMPLDGFVSALEAQQRMLKQVADQQKAQQAQAAPAA